MSFQETMAYHDATAVTVPDCVAVSRYRQVCRFTIVSGAADSRLMNETVIETACYAHPEVTFHVHACRFCDRAVCQDCRVSQRIGGSIPALVCHDCVKLQERQRVARQGKRVLGVVALIGVVLAIAWSPLALVLPLLVGIAWMALSYRRLRSGMGTPWDVLSVFSIFRRFL